jgi:hypothetical protein
MEAVEVDARWVGNALRNLDRVWDVLTPQNRGRLLRALIERVTLDRASGNVAIHLANLDADDEIGPSMEAA